MSEWIKWAGGKCPVDPSVLVNYRFRDDDFEGFVARAEDLRWTWNHGGYGGDIHFFRIVEDTK